MTACSQRGRSARPGRRVRTLSGIASFAVFAMMACASPEDPSARAAAPTAEIASAVSYDCKSRFDTGYSKGNPFAIEVVTVAGYPVEIHTADALITMMAAAEAQGVSITLTDGFRTMSEQTYYSNCWKNCGPQCSSCYLAAEPGYSNHQSGHAIDFGNGIGWIFQHGAEFGFDNTVGAASDENFHWEWWGGGNPKPYCACRDTCVGNVLNRKSCEKTDCGAKGAACVNDEAGLRCDALPRGSLDVADGATTSGWAQDPSVADAPITARVSFGGPSTDPLAVATEISASVARSDLCGLLGSCAHAFSVWTPRSLLDNAPHPVHAYGLDATGAPSAELAGSPRTLRAPPPAIDASTVLRRVPSESAFAAWQLSLFWDVAPLPDESAKVSATLQEGAAFPSSPSFVQIAEAPEIAWTIEEGRRRKITDRAAWHVSNVTTIGAPELYAIPEGPPLSAHPLVVRAPGPTYFVLDTAPAAPGAAGGVPVEPGSGSAGAGGRLDGASGAATSVPVGADGGDEGACGFAGAARSSSRSVAWGGALLAMIVGASLRRRRTRSGASEATRR